MYETFEHTADLGLRVHADNLEDLFQEAGRGLASIIVENVTDVRQQEQITIKVEGSDRTYLFFDWLNELLYRFESEHLVLVDFEIEFTPTGLTARAGGEIIEPESGRLAHEVKAITYHGLTVEEADDGWHAEVIVDI